MSVSPAVLGAAIAERRTALRYAPSDVQRLARLSESRLLEIERGIGPAPTLLEVEHLGRALVFDPADLLQSGHLPDPRRLPGWFQSHSDEESDTDLHPDDIRLVLLAAECAEIGSFLLRELYGRETAKILHVREPRGVQDAETDGKELGPRKRREVDALVSGQAPDEALGPIASVQTLLEELDVHVADVALATHRKGAISIVRAGLMPVILVNGNHTKSRRAVTRRMLLAHEIAHILLDGGEQEMGGTPVDRLRDLEVRANNFAPNFLAPPEDVRHLTVNVTEPAAIVNVLADLFGLSFEAAAWHAANCGAIERAIARDLISESQTLSHGPRSNEARWESSEHAARPRETSSSVTPHPIVHGLLSDLVFEATRRGILSERRGREILEVS